MIPKIYKQKCLCSFNDDFDITIETAENHLMLSVAHLGHNLGHRPCSACTTLGKWAWQFVGCKQRICKPPKAARMETNGPTGYEKRNLGQMCHTVVCRWTEPAGSTMPLISLELSDTESWNFTHIKTGLTTTFGYEIFFARERAKGAAPPCKIWDTVYISETIRARKSKILQDLGSVKCSCRMWIFFPLGGVSGAQHP